MPMASVGYTSTWGSPSSNHQMELSAAQKEVQALLDKPCMTGRKEGSGIVERLEKRHKERHEQLLIDLQEELTAINENLQPAVTKAAEELKQKQEASLQVMEAALASISDCETMREVEGVWQGVESQLDHRLKLIEEMGKQLLAVEDLRCEQACECLRCHSGKLGGVAYCNAGELASLMEDKAHDVNMTSLANRRSVIQLCTRLTEAELEVGKQLQSRWREKAGKWRDGKLRATLSGFQVCIGVGGEGGVERGRREGERVKAEIIAELSGLQLRKQELLTQLSSVAPSTVVMETLHRLRDISHGLDQQMESCVGRKLLSLGQVVDQVSQLCEVEMDVCKDSLLLRDVCDSSTVYQVLNADYLPLTQQLVEQTRAELHSIEQYVGTQLAQQKSWFQSVLQYGMGAAQLWRDHSTALAEVKRSRGEVLERLRANHDIMNQNREANLDVILDHMRQAPNNEVLDQCLEEATSLLKVICEGYEEFHRAVLSEVGAWPAGVEQCVLEYETALCQYLGVDQVPPTSSSKKERSKGRRGKAGSKRSKKTTPTPRPPSVATIVEEIVVAGGVAKYYVTRAEDKGSVFLTQNEESEEAPHMIANQALPLSRDTFEQARARVRALYLGHLETWRRQVRGEEEVREREEEAHSELDLRLHLHKPRLGRITQDIHSVRAAELLAHTDRVTRHARAVVAAINDIKTTAYTAHDAMKTQEEEYCQEMTALEISLTQSSSSVGLTQLETKARHLLEKRLHTLDGIASSLQSSAVTALTDLNTSNTAFRQSLKLFSEAGNYCPEEVELFSHKLDRLAGKIVTAQPQVLQSVCEASNEHTQRAREKFTHFQNTYQLRWTDVCYMEEVKRSLTSLQMSIRSVVAASNSQASRLHDDITKLQDALKSGDPTPVLEGLPPLVDLCTQRTAYLYCRATLQQGGRVGGEGEGGREDQPISAVNITQSIRDHTRASSHKSPARPVQPQVKEVGRKTGPVSRRKPVAAVVERKNVNFGVGGGEDGTSCFLPQIRALLSSSYTDLHTTTETYYRNKGSRPVTSEDMTTSCEEALDRLIDTCQTYCRQCEEYRNKAVTEFRGQLESLLTLLVGVAPLVMEGCKRCHMIRWERKREGLRKTHSHTMQEMMESKVSHERSLHPGLGHPAASEQLQQLRQAEELRHRQCLEYIHYYTSSIQASVRGIGRELAAELVTETERLMRLYDTIPTTNEIIPGNVVKTELTMDQLLRQKMRPHDEVKDDEGVTPLSSQGDHWPGLAADHLAQLCLESKERTRLREGVESRKNCVAHRTVITARDTVLQELVRCVEEEVEESERWGREERGKEERWWDHWNHSLSSLGQLYST